MDWLRSEDLKEEKGVTAPIVIIAGQERLVRNDCTPFQFLKCEPLPLPQKCAA